MRRIGITQRVAHLVDINERRDCLDQSWTTLLQSCGFTPVLIPNALNDVVGYVTDGLVEGVIFSGGNDLCALSGGTNTSPERDRTEAELYRYCVSNAIPLLGVCRGMQMILAQDGVLPEHIDAHVAVVHEVRATHTRLLPLPERFVTNSFHDWGFENTTESKSYVTTATSADGSVEAIEHHSAAIAGIMWHPERTPVNELSRQVLIDFFDPPPAGRTGY